MSSPQLYSTHAWSNRARRPTIFDTVCQKCNHGPTVAGKYIEDIGGIVAQYSLQDNAQYAFLQLDDRVLVYRGADQPDMSVINPEADVWQHIKVLALIDIDLRTNRMPNLNIVDPAELSRCQLADTVFMFESRRKVYRSCRPSWARSLQLYVWTMEIIRRRAARAGFHSQRRAFVVPPCAYCCCRCEECIPST